MTADKSGEVSAVIDRRYSTLDPPDKRSIIVMFSHAY
jgi:hypothetical protein